MGGFPSASYKIFIKIKMKKRFIMLQKQKLSQKLTLKFWLATSGIALISVMVFLTVLNLSKTNDAYATAIDYDNFVVGEEVNSDQTQLDLNKITSLEIDEIDSVRVEIYYTYQDLSKNKYTMNMFSGNKKLFSKKIKLNNGKRYRKKKSKSTFYNGFCTEIISGKKLKDKKLRLELKNEEIKVHSFVAYVYKKGGKATKKDLKSYVVSEKYAKVPFLGESYYQEKNGKNKKATIDEISEKLGLSVYPSPYFKGKLNIKINGKQGESKIKLLDSNKDIVYTSTQFLPNGMNYIIDVDVSRHMSGIYNLEVENGDYKWHQKIVVAN